MCLNFDKILEVAKNMQNTSVMLNSIGIVCINELPTQVSNDIIIMINIETFFVIRRTIFIKKSI